MKALIERGERIAREAQRRRIDELASTVSTSLPQAEIETLPDGVGVRAARLVQRWLEDGELRFAARTGR